MLDVMEELSMSSAVGMGSKEQVEDFAMTTSPMIWALGFGLFRTGARCWTHSIHGTEFSSKPWCRTGVGDSLCFETGDI